MRTNALITLTLLIALTSCAADAAQESAPPTATDAPSVAPTVAPTPMATPIDVPQAFASRMLEITELRADISGTIQVGEALGEYSGTLETVGSETHERLVVTFSDGTPHVSETIEAADASYVLTDGIWIRTQRAGSGTGEGEGAEAAINIETIMDAALRDPARLTLTGTEVIGGDRLLRLDIQDAPAIPGHTLGFTDPTIAEFEASVAFLAEDDGTPAGILVEGTWVQGTDAVAGVMDLRYRFAPSARDVTVTAPTDPWEIHAGEELGYRMAHPVGWTIEYKPATAEFPPQDLYLGKVDDEVQVVAYDDLMGARDAADWFRGSAQSILHEFGSEPEVSDPLVLEDGSEVRILTLHYQDGSDEIFFQEAAIVRGTEAWDIFMFSFAGNEAEDGETLLNMLMSFEPTE